MSAHRNHITTVQARQPSTQSLYETAANCTQMCLAAKAVLGSLTLGAPGASCHPVASCHKDPCNIMQGLDMTAKGWVYADHMAECEGPPDCTM